MKHDKRDKVVGGIIMAILFGVPLAIFLQPIAVIVFIVCLVIGLSKKESTPPKITKRQQQSDELVTVVLPTISSDS